MSADYSGTPLSRKLGAKPGIGVVVFFTTSRADLERRFPQLKETLGPADGLWIAWPKKAARIEGDLSFESVQEVGLANGLVDNKSCSIDRIGIVSGPARPRSPARAEAESRRRVPRATRMRSLDLSCAPQLLAIELCA